MPEPVEVDRALLRSWALPGPGDDKEERGNLLVVAGSARTPGAGLLAAEAALRAGAGKVELATAGSCVAALAVAAPELMVTGLDEDGAGDIAPTATDAVADCARSGSAVLVGPGFTDPGAAADLVARLAPEVAHTLVMDALATAYVTGRPEAVAALSCDVVLTVNPTELAACLELDPEVVDDDLVAHTRLLARRTQAVVLCGGPVKVVAHGDDVWVAEVGNPGLGTAGSGDVQAGLVTGLLGRGAQPVQAAVWGAYLHGTAGDRVADRVGPLGYLARELGAEVPALLAELGGADG